MNKIQTERLVLCPYTKSDFEEFATLRGDKRVMEYMVGGVMTRVQALETFEAYLTAWQTSGLGMWAIWDAATLNYVGECGFWDRGGEVGLTVRYLLHKKYWGKGLAGDAVNAAVKFGFETAGLTSLSAVALNSNARSCSILERLGMTVINENHQGIEGFRHYVLSLNETGFGRYDKLG